MTLQEIRAAVDSGKTVHWSTPAYTVIRDGIGQWLIYCNLNGDCIGLTHQDGITVNGDSEDFYIA